MSTLLSSLPTRLSSNTLPQRQSRRAGIVACRLRGHLLEEEVEGQECRLLAEEGQEAGALVGFRGVGCRVRREVLGVESQGGWGGRREGLGLGEEC